MEGNGKISEKLETGSARAKNKGKENKRKEEEIKKTQCANILKQKQIQIESDASIKLDLPPRGCMPPRTSQVAVYIYVCPGLT